jgi:hypothetical protein
LIIEKEKIMSRFAFCFLVFSLVFTSCAVRYQSSVFSPDRFPLNYSEKNTWAVLPEKIPSVLDTFAVEKAKNPVDIFFVYPTILDDKKDQRWNASIKDSLHIHEVLNSTIKYQASAWFGLGDMYAPFYRQAHIRSFREEFKQNGGDAALDYAYQDVKHAFEYYLEHFNQGKPIVIASHSQGTLHAARLIKDFFDGKPLRDQLVAAYLVGIGIPKDAFSDVQLMKQPDETGGFVSWNAYKKEKLPKRYNYWYKGKTTTNPITWDHQLTSDYKDHKGVLYSDLKIYPQSLEVMVNNGMLWVTLPKIPKRFWLSFVSNYHFADINLFWEDIRQNTQLRIDSYFKKN